MRFGVSLKSIENQKEKRRIMKKILSVFSLMLLVAAFSFTACSKSEKVSSNRIKSLKFDVNVVNGSASGSTKAVKTEWVVGDKMFVFFNVSEGTTTGYLNAMKYVTLTYNGTDWDGELSGELVDANDLGTAGTMYGVYFPYFDQVEVVQSGVSGVKFQTKGSTNPDLNGQPMFTYYMSGNTSYTVETSGDVGTLRGKIRVYMPDNYVYFFINKDGEKYISNEKYHLAVEGVSPVACSGYSNGGFTEKSLGNGRPMPGYTFNDAGIAFSGKIDNSWAVASDHSFSLFEDGETTLSRIFNKALASHKSIRLEMNTNWAKCAFRGYEVSPGILMRNSNGTYALTDGKNPFEMWDYFGNDASKQKYYFTWTFLKSELGADGDNINSTSDKLPEGWILPSASADGSVWGRIIRNSPSSAIRIEKSDNTVSTVSGTESGYAFVIVTKGAKEHFGMILLRDGAFISKAAGIDHWGKGSAFNNIDDEQLQVLLDAGCLFISATGGWFIDSWRYIENNQNAEAGFWSCTYASSKSYKLNVSRYSSPSVTYKSGTNSGGSQYYPVKLAKAI